MHTQVKAAMVIMVKITPSIPQDGKYEKNSQHQVCIIDGTRRSVDTVQPNVNKTKYFRLRRLDERELRGELTES